MIRNVASRIKYRRIFDRNAAREHQTLSDLGFDFNQTDDYTTEKPRRNTLACLVEFIRRRRPKRVIEFGTGKSTWIIAAAMERYCRDLHGSDMVFVSMEDDELWYKEQLRFFPDEKLPNARDFVKIVLSPIEQYQYRYLTGIVYRDMPQEHFDLCFIDGASPKETCCMDFIKVLENSDAPVSCLLDSRKTTQMAYAALIGKAKMTRYHTGVCLFENVTAEELTGRNYKSLFSENEVVLRL